MSINFQYDPLSPDCFIHSEKTTEQTVHWASRLKAPFVIDEHRLKGHRALAINNIAFWSFIYAH